MGKTNQILFGIEESIFLDGKIAIVSSDHRRGVVRVRKYPQNVHASGGKFSVEVSNLRYVAVRDGTIAGCKNQHDEPRAGPAQIAHGTAVEVHTQLLSSAKARRSQRDCKQNGKSKGKREIAHNPRVNDADYSRPALQLYRPES